MQPAEKPDDIHTILSRFSNWSGKDSGKRRASEADAGVREISYEEAIRKMRSRRAGAGGATTPAPASAAPEEEAAHAAATAPPVANTATAPKTARVAHPRKTAPAKVSPLKRKPPKAAEFRQVLAKAVGQTASAGTAKVKKAERAQRVSVRLSKGEERQLQAYAAQAGVTVSEYLRTRALEGSAQRGPVGVRAEDAAARRVTAEPAATKNALGGWITLLRNRFLSSPVRFAERA